MKMLARTDVDLGAEALFAALTDFPAWEELALRQGIEVERQGEAGPVGPGTTWIVHFIHRGRGRDTRLAITKLTAPSVLSVGGEIGGFDYQSNLTLVPLAKSTTRLALEIEVRPRTLAARIVIQTAKLARGRLNNRLSTRFDAFGRLLAERARRQAGA